MNNNSNRKRLANIFLLMAFLLYLLSINFLETSYFFHYLKAFSEAAIVGGIADWFAVTALFRHPLGLKIPHTAIIPKSKSKIAKNISKFIRENFLSVEYVKDNLNKFDIKNKILTLLIENKQTILDYSLKYLSNYLKNFDHKVLLPLFTPILNKKINDIDLKKISIELIKLFKKENYHHLLFLKILKSLNSWLSNPKNEKEVNEALKNIIKKNEAGETSFSGLIKSLFLGEPKLHKYLTDFISSIEKDSNKKVLLKLDDIFNDIYNEFHNNKELKIKLNDLKDKILKEINLEEEINSFLLEIKNYIIINIDNKDSDLNFFINNIYDDLLIELKNNHKFNNWLNYIINEKIPKLMTDNIEFIDYYFSSYIEKLDTIEVSNLIENKVGEDLQFIRINGTIIGGIIGLTLFLITDFLKFIGDLNVI